METIREWYNRGRRQWSGTSVGMANRVWDECMMAV